VLSVPWEALCVDLIGPYTLKGKDGSSIDFMALTMIDPASSWLEVVELPTITRVMTKTVNVKRGQSKKSPMPDLRSKKEPEVGMTEWKTQNLVPQRLNFTG
jgi:hypothetical protein